MVTKYLVIPQSSILILSPSPTGENGPGCSSHLLGVQITDFGLPHGAHDETRGGLMVSALHSGASGQGSSPGRGQCVVFLGKTLNSHSASLHPGV